MSDLASEIFKKYGVAALIFAVVASVGVWSLAHWTALPGAEVSVLWGLVKYTKRLPEKIHKPTSLVEDRRDERQSAAGEVRADIPNPVAAPLTLLVRHNISSENVDTALEALRSDRRLRELTAVESGRTIADTPSGTYFFTLGAWLDSRLRYDGDGENWVHNFVEPFTNLSVSRFRTSHHYVEIHYPQSEEPNLILFVDEVSAAAISILPGDSQHELMAAIAPWGNMSTMLSLPVSRVLESKDREVEIAEDTKVTVLDLVVH